MPHVQQVWQASDINIAINLLLVFLEKAICFYIGYNVIKIGSALLREGVTGKFTFKGEFKGIKADLASVSPGLLFLLLGIFIIGFALLVVKGPHEIESGSDFEGTSQNVRASKIINSFKTPDMPDMPDRKEKYE